MDAGHPAESFELVPLAGGIYSLRSLANRQTFHPVVGPQKEAETVHVGGTRLTERAGALPSGQELVIWDVGLGAAANALAAVRALLPVDFRRPAEISLFSFDLNLTALEFALSRADALRYPIGYEPALQSLIDDGKAWVQIGATTIHWRVLLGDFPAVLAGSPGYPAPHAIFYDPYSPTVNSEMWTLEVFTALLAHTRQDVPCLLTTYTRSTAVRVTLLLAGWCVGVGGATGEKDETTVAANAAEWLEQPLSRDWLEKKVYASTNAAPLRTGNGPTRGPISEEDFERLRRHPQFV